MVIFTFADGTHTRGICIVVVSTVSHAVELQHVTDPVTKINAEGHDLTDTQQARAKYLQAGYDAIPLKPLTKDPACKGWPTRATITQWHNAPADSNIGLRAGHGKAFIDCDDKNQAGTFTNVTRWLEGLGHATDTLPIVRTPSGGAHVYVNFTGGLFASKKNLLHTIGAGEFRYDYGAYVTAPPSIIAGGLSYTLVNGSVDRLPVLDLHDVAQLVDINGDTKPQAAPKMSRLALALSLGNEDILQERYNGDRSSAEAALVLSLINSGYDYQAIKHIFENNPCMGHFHQKHAAKSNQEAERWLYMTYQEAFKYSQRVSPARRLIGEFLEAARSAAWSNANRRKVFISHLEIAYHAGKFEYAAGVRDIALGAGVHKDTAQNQTRKLLTEGLLTLKERGNTISASVYVLDREKLGHSLKTLNVRKCPKFSQHDAFRNGGGRYAKGRLGRRAGEVYELLYDNPLTFSEIVGRTGASPKTVREALRKLSKVIDHRTGEVIQMVIDEGDTWRAVLVDLEQIAAIVRTYGATGRQRAEYDKQRRAHRRSLEIGTLLKMAA
jgi:hypothetical protein